MAAEAKAEEGRTNPRRHRRLDLRAVARAVLSRRACHRNSELDYASRQLTSIEINGTFYRTQTPASFAKWRDETPDDFVFSVKAPRYIVQQRALAETAELIAPSSTAGLPNSVRQARTDSLAVRADQEIRPRRFRRVSRSCCRASSAVDLCVTRSNRATTASPAKNSSPSRENMAWRS